jgi:hypothetical protein
MIAELPDQGLILRNSNPGAVSRLTIFLGYGKKPVVPLTNVRSCFQCSSPPFSHKNEEDKREETADSRQKSKARKKEGCWLLSITYSQTSL